MDFFSNELDFVNAVKRKSENLGNLYGEVFDLEGFGEEDCPKYKKTKNAIPVWEAEVLRGINFLLDDLQKVEEEMEEYDLNHESTTIVGACIEWLEEPYDCNYAYEITEAIDEIITNLNK